MASTKNERYGLMSFTGPAGRTYFDRDGVLQTAGENEIREEYDPLTGAYRGMLIESQERTNHLSEPVDLSKWGVRSGASISKTDRSLGPDYPVYLVDASAESNSRIVLPFNVSEGPGTYVLSLYVATKSGSSGTYTLLSFSNGSIGRTRKQFNVGSKLERVSMQIEISDELSGAAYILDNREDNSETEFLVAAAQLEKGTSPSSFLVGSLPGEDARFTDPAVFNNFERGAFFIDFKSIMAHHDSWVLYRSSLARFLYYHTDNLRVYDGSHAVSQSMSEGSLYTPHKYQVSWDRSGVRTNVDGSKTESMPFDGNWSRNDLIIGNRWAGYIKNLDFSPEPYTEEQGRQVTKRDASIIIGECPNGGYYDYSDLSTLFIESDESDIPVRERTLARVGDPVGAILDKSGHDNHLTASDNSRRGILRFDGENYYIERGIVTIYGFDFVSDRSLTAIIGLQNYDDNFIVLCVRDGGRGDYAMIYGPGTGRYLNWGLFSDPRYYFNGEYQQVSNRGEAQAGLTTDPIVLRTLHQVQNDVSTRIYVGGYTSASWDLTGNEYGFAWGSRLSEDDALIVEQEMQQNMPLIG